MVKAYLETDETEQLENAATCMRDKLPTKLLARLADVLKSVLANLHDGGEA